MEHVGQGIKTQAIDVSRFRMENNQEAKVAVDNAKAQLEYQHNRLVNLELMKQFGSNAWRISNFQLEGLVQSLQEQTRVLREQITSIHHQRQQEQVIRLI